MVKKRVGKSIKHLENNEHGRGGGGGVGRSVWPMFCSVSVRPLLSLLLPQVLDEVLVHLRPLLGNDVEKVVLAVALNSKYKLEINQSWLGN